MLSRKLGLLEKSPGGESKEVFLEKEYPIQKRLGESGGGRGRGGRGSKGPKT